MNPSTANLSPNQKSAILLMSVPPEVAAETLKLRSPEEVAGITYEINYTRLSLPIQAQVLAECLDMMAEAKRYQRYYEAIMERTNKRIQQAECQAQAVMDEAQAAAQQLIQQYHQQAQQQAQAMMEQANMQIQQAAEQVQRQAQEIGFQQGYEQGLQQGDLHAQQQKLVYSTTGVTIEQPYRAREQAIGSSEGSRV